MSHLTLRAANRVHCSTSARASAASPRRPALQLKDTTLSATAKDVFALAGRFDQGPISVGASYQSKADANGKDFSSIAGSFDFKVVKVMASYTQAGKIADGGTGKGYGLGITAPVGGFNIGAIYGTNDDDLAKITSYELFINREIFKNTYAYGEYGDWKSDLTGGSVKCARALPSA